jgi:hypothetical protein
MKKLFAVLALVGVMTSCKDKKKDEKQPDATTTTTTTDPNTTTTTTTTTTTATSGVPTFADADVQKYVNDYTDFVNAIVAAYKSKDLAKAGELAGKASEWSSKSMTIAQKLSTNPEDAKKFSDYVTKLSSDMTAAMQMPAQ